MTSLFRIHCTRTSTPAYPFGKWARGVVFCVIAGALCGWALVLAVNASYPCQWPSEWDTLRDVGMAQSILDGRYPEDPILLGETLWYNPLTGAIIALAHVLSGLPLYRLSIVIGPYVNLLAPVGIVVLLATLFGRVAALAGLCVLLFAKDPQLPFWVQASYSPWLLAPLYSLGLLFLTLTAYYQGLKTGSLRRHLLAGLLLGITFMAHTAPALVAGGTMSLMLLIETSLSWRRKHEPDANTTLTTQLSRPLLQLPAYFLSLLAVAFIISLPYTWSILLNYRFHVYNPFPSLYAADYVSLEQLPNRLREALNWRNALAIAGVGSLLARRRDAAARFALCWAAVVVLFAVQHYLWQALLARGVVWPSFVPGHHAAIHLSAMRAVLFAAGATALGAAAISGAGAALCAYFGRPPSTAATTMMRYGGATAAAIGAGLALYSANPLSARVDFQAPDAALYHQFHEQGIPMYQWILENTAPDSVFLCEEEVSGMTVVMPAARKIVAPMLLYSNPYVSPEPLFDKQRILFDAIEDGDRATLCDEARHYPSLYLLTREDGVYARHRQVKRLFDKAHSAGGLVVWRMHPCQETSHTESNQTTP